jgi:hypothetical protein
VPKQTDAERLGLPVKAFFYYPDQVATMLSVTETQLTTKMLFYMGRSAGAPPRDKIKATNMMPDGQEPVWRISEKHLTQWLKFKGFRFYTPGFT